jgi:hypothetical protein
VLFPFILLSSVEKRPGVSSPRIFFRPGRYGRLAGLASLDSDHQWPVAIAAGNSRLSRFALLFRTRERYYAVAQLVKIVVLVMAAERISDDAADWEKATPNWDHWDG